MDAEAKAMVVNKLKSIVQNAGGYWSSQNDQLIDELIDALMLMVAERMAGDSPEAQAARESIACAAE
ncbi:MAG: hypothetical protein ACOX9A_04560 [Anaerolineae bacterium]|jgi:hypothetical protein